jgi:hypothetical protein
VTGKATGRATGCDLDATAAPDERIWRLGRAPAAWEWTDWNYAEADGAFGNRFDDPKSAYRVLDTSSRRLGTFVEVLSRFRKSPAVIAGLAEIVVDEEDEPLDRDAAPPGCVPVAWLDGREIGSAALADAAYARVSASRSLAYIRTVLAERLVHYGIDLDASTIRLADPRAFTQEVSRLVYECSTVTGERAFAGIAYESRFGDEFLNWAIFEDEQFEPFVHCESERLRRDDDDLRAALELHDLAMWEPPL